MVSSVQVPRLRLVYTSACLVTLAFLDFVMLMLLNEEYKLCNVFNNLSRVLDVFSHVCSLI